MKLYWVNHKWRGGKTIGIETHSKKLADAVAALGVEIVFDPSEPYDAAVHINEPEDFRPIPGKVNIAFLQVELSAPRDPAIWQRTISKADCLVTSCEHSKAIESKYYPKKNIYICPLGTDPDAFPFVPRVKPPKDQPFRFLWINNAGPEKGSLYMRMIWETWGKTGTRPPNCELYMKISGGGLEELENLTVLPGNLTLDKQVYPTKQLHDLYAKANCFIDTSMGDGWGLTLSEAMSTGLPSIWPAHSAFIDWADPATGYPVSDLYSLPFYKNDEDAQTKKKPIAYGLAVKGAALVARMEEIYNNYPEALRRGRLASERMHTRYTWKQAAARFIEICKEAVP